MENTVLWLDCIPQNLEVETLIRSVMTLGGGAFRRSSGHEGKALTYGTVPSWQRLSVLSAHYEPGSGPDTKSESANINPK